MKDEQLRKHLNAKDIFINQERKLGIRRQSDTIIFPPPPPPPPPNTAIGKGLNT